MQRNHNIDKLVEDTLNSVDGIQRASPAPYLLTRINQAGRNVNPGLFESLLRFITRPAIAILVLFFIITLNILIITSGNGYSIDKNYEEMTGYSATGPAAVYEIDNIIP